jgi:hypothetical protein
MLPSGCYVFDPKRESQTHGRFQTKQRSGDCDFDHRRLEKIHLHNGFGIGILKMREIGVQSGNSPCFDPTDQYTLLYSFTNGADGGYPLSPVLLDGAGNL